MSRVIRLVPIVLLGFVGAFLAVGSDAGTGIDRKERRLAVIQDQLVDLKGLLSDYRAKHGRYPSNDEGLAALDNFETSFSTRAYPRPSTAPATSPTFRGFRLAWPWWATHKGEARKFRQKHGHSPANPAEFDECYSYEPGQCGVLHGTDARIAFTRNDNIFVVTPAGVMSPWMLPYVYENRNGLDGAAFAGSPVEADRKSRYSIRVDDGVYVYSVGPERVAGELDAERREFYRPRLVGGGMLLLALGLAVWLILHKPASGAGAWLLVGSAVAGLAANGMLQPSCYVMSPMFSDRGPEMVLRQRELLDKYRAAGVISLQTYQKAVSALEHPFPAATQGDASGEAK